MALARRLKATAIWVDPEDKMTFERILLERKAETGISQTQESMFKFMLECFFQLMNIKHKKNYRRD